MKNNLKYFFVIMLALFSCNSIAASLQLFTGLNYSNPANLALVKKGEFILSLTAIEPHLRFEGKITDPMGTTLSTSATSNELLLLPNARLALRLNDQVVVGVDFTKPFASDVRYAPSNPIAIVATNTVIDTVNIAPNIAVQITKDVSIGFGLDAQYLEADIDQVLNLTGFPPPFPPVLPLLPSSGAEFKNHGSDWGYGWHAGIQARLAKGTFLGASYFSSIEHDLEGPSTYMSMPTKIAKTKVTLPATSIVTLTQFITRGWLVQGAIAYTQWDVLDELVMTNTVFGTQSLPLHYKNVFRYSLGTRYEINKKFTVKGSISYDNSPGSKGTSARAPDNDILGLAIGLHYQATKAVGVDLNYAHAFIKNHAINNVTNRVLNVGTAHLSSNLLEIQLTAEA